MSVVYCVVSGSVKSNNSLTGIVAVSRSGLLLLLVTVALLLSGCSGRITPPMTPEIPRMVFVVDHGQHSSLIIENRQGDITRYSYGDWHYYAKGQTSILSGLRAVLIPGQSALGRKQLAGPASVENIQKQLRIAVVNVISFTAEASAVDNLQQKLESIYQQHQTSRIYRKDYDLDFVHHPKPYSLRHNSNQVVGQWLSELGGEVHGWPLLSNWKIEPAVKRD